MLHFNEDYFKTEKRDGFVINELMKRAWAAQLEVLGKVIEICDKYNITYYAYYGTLLGTIRHQGYIPWDDDLDIAMTKENYIRFLEVAKNELPEEYCILNCYTETEYEHMLTRITNGPYIDLSDKRMSEYHGCPFSVGIDIFPLYYVPRDPGNAAVQNAILTAITEIFNVIGEADLTNDENKAVLMEGLSALEQATGYQFTDDRPLYNHLKILYDQISRLFTEQESDALAIFPTYFQGGYIIEKELLAESVQMPFENIMLNVPKGYDAILRKMYGEYMTPRNVRAGHDYPFYKGQLQELVKYMDEQAAKEKGLNGEVLTDAAEVGIDEKTGIQLPKEWLDKLYADGRRKKILLYHTSADSLICQETYTDTKLRYVFDLCRENEDILLWWMPGISGKTKLDYVKQMAPKLMKGYEQATKEFLEGNIGIYDDSGDLQRAIFMADAYFGDDGEVLNLFKETGKPIMIQDYEIAQ